MKFTSPGNQCTRGLIVFRYFLQRASPAEVRSQIFHGHLDYITPNTYISCISAHAVHSSCYRSHTNRD
ncbi:hypothetical protein OIU74_007669 [Salix koriyanagi]|uniref:Uncharacterized protein n=1 Tax=Salix koriyanagi TaxID=2511006 RepID=A0A9Q0U485_9ROSI|nr:hypothetical protein OIU74_007669 [Salix koriyanagi]